MKNGLSARLNQLLEHCIEDYIKTAVPIASGAVSVSMRERPGNPAGGLSPASIRSDLKTLEEMGYLRQIHTSGGRVPTAEGYRRYVNQIMGNLNIQPGEFTMAAEKISGRIAELPSTLDEICEKLGATFNYPIVVRQQFDRLTVLNVQIVNMLAGAVLVLIKTSAGHLSQGIQIGDLTERQCLDAAAALNSRCIGLSLRSMLFLLPRIAKEIKKDLYFFEQLCKKLGDKLEQTIDRTLSRKVNVMKLLDMPDFEKVKKLKSAIEDEETLDNVLDQEQDVFIDDEMGVIKFNYRVGDVNIAKIGIVGPADHMDYKTLIGALHGLMSQVSQNRMDEKLQGGNKNERQLEKPQL